MYGHFTGGNFQSVFSSVVAERLEGGGRGCGALCHIYVLVGRMINNEALDRTWGNACAKKGTVPAKGKNSLFRVKRLSSTRLLEVVHLFCRVTRALLAIVSAASDPIRLSKQHENTIGHDHIEIELCGDLGINNKTPNRMLTPRLSHTKCINASPRIRFHASIRLKIRKKEK